MLTPQRLLALLLLFVFAATAFANDGHDDGKIIDLNQKRFERTYRQFAETLRQMIEVAPPVDHSPMFRERAYFALRDQLEREAPRFGPITYDQLARAFASVDNPRRYVMSDFENLTPLDRELVFERFLREELERVEGRADPEALAIIASHLSAPGAYQALFADALPRARNETQLLELASIALAKPAFKGDAIYESALGLMAAFRREEVNESDFLAVWLRKLVQRRLRTPYDRRLLLETLEPMLERHLDSTLIDLLSDISRSEWLPTDVQSTALGFLRRWQFSGYAAGKGLRRRIDQALDPALGPVRAPLKVCALLLLGR